MLTPWRAEGGLAEWTAHRKQALVVISSSVSVLVGLQHHRHMIGGAVETISGSLNRHTQTHKMLQ